MTLAAHATRPLAGQRLLVTRASRQAGSLVSRLEELGATVVVLPTIEIAPANPAPLDGAIERLDAYDWVVFTSANGVAAFLDRLHALGLTSASLDGVHVCAIGSATAERLQDAGIAVDLIPQQFIAESVVDELRSIGVSGKRMLLPQADIARETVARGLTDAGATVDVVVAYRTLAPEGNDPDAVRRLLTEIDLVTFASPSSVRNLVTLAGGDVPEMQAVCIGPVTASAALEMGITVVAVAEEFSSDGLIEALLNVVASREHGGSG